MQYGEIIKKAWRLTWRFKYLWILAIFAGVTGPGGGGGYSSSGRGFGNSGSSGSSPFGSGSQAFLTGAREWIPVLIAAAVIFFMLAIVWAILTLAARGGLIWAVDEIEEGRKPRLSQAWGAGFSRWWALFGFGFLLGIPGLVVVLLLLAGIGIPILLSIKDGAFNPGMLVPICGSLVIALPVIFVVSVIVGIMSPLGMRAIMIERRGVIEAISESWQFFRHRFKDSILMWLISGGLNIAAGFVLAIPLVIISLVFVLPAVFAGVGENWGVLAGVVGVWVVVIMALSIAFTAVWGTFTSALWTIFFRRLIGKEPQPRAESPFGDSYMPPQPYAPVAPAEPAGPVGPPMAPMPPAQPTPPTAPATPPAQPTPPTAPAAPAAPPMAPPAPPSEGV